MYSVFCKFHFKIIRELHQLIKRNLHTSIISYQLALLDRLVALAPAGNKKQSSSSFGESRPSSSNGVNKGSGNSNGLFF